MRKNILIFIILLSLGLYSCEKFLEPYGQNYRSEDEIIYNPAYAEGILLRGYISMPSGYDFELDVASDDAVTNDRNSTYRRMAVGEWKSTFDPIEQWTNAYAQIYYLNKFIEISKSVVWARDSVLPKPNRELRNILFAKRLKGEAYGLRGWYKWRLLQYHGGRTADNRLLGFPIIDNTIDISDNWKLPRDTYGDCVASIFNDLDTAIKYLPATWFDRPTGGTNPVVNGDTNIAMGARYENRINSNTARALKARVALLAASPSFADGSGVTWEQAAILAGPLLKKLGALYANGRVFYKEIKNKEIIWNRAQVSIRSWELNNFPPSLFGNGRTNPSQNLVDAFGMKNGYPINNTPYDPTKPYLNRDPRLTDYIIYNGATLKSKPIYTYIGAPSDGINVLMTSTRSGYYLKKFMSESVNLDPSTTGTNSAHTYTFVRMTELLLNFAEAANEAWGTTGDPIGYGFTAKSKIQELRARAGITQPDAYLNSIIDKDGLRELIRNERRIELCFEGFRFWDIRRWGDVQAMQQPVKGANLTEITGGYSFQYPDVEIRAFSPDMIYGPIPYKEVLKYNIDQNNGW